VITDEHVDHYRTFGFVILRRQLDGHVVERLSAEMDAAFRVALGPRYDERPDSGGISGHYLPAMSCRSTPVSLQIVEQLHPVARRLLGSDVLPAPAEAILLFDRAPWHDDTGFEVTAVKFAAYLEPLDAGNGALRVLPGSHGDPFAGLARMFDRRVTAQTAADVVQAVERLPSFVCDTEPGDVIAFDLRLLHASIHGRDRRQWTVTYYRDPVSPEETREVRAALLDEVAADYGSWGEYDPREYPFFDPEWIAGLEGTWRARTVARLRELGVLDAAARSSSEVPGG
jgi:hypothetical protein